MTRKMEQFKVIITMGLENPSESDLEYICEGLEELDIKQKIYGSIRNLLRERFEYKFDIDVEVSD